MNKPPYTDLSQTLALMNDAIAQAAEAFNAMAETIGQVVLSAQIHQPDAIAPFACWGCRNYVGFTNDRDERLICAMHPNVPEEKVCLDSTLRAS